jgi:hypothetical protein
LVTVKALTHPLVEPIATLQVNVPNDQRLVEMWLHGRSAHRFEAEAAELGTAALTARLHRPAAT